MVRFFICIEFYQICIEVLCVFVGGYHLKCEGFHNVRASPHG